MELEKNFQNEIIELIKKAKSTLQKSIDTALVDTYFKIGKRIVEEEQNGKERAELHF